MSIQHAAGDQQTSKAISDAMNPPLYSRTLSNRSIDQTDGHTSLLIHGDKVMTGRDLQEYALRNGLCQICGQVKTHRNKSNFLGRVPCEPLTVTNEEGQYTVYKGFCLQPTCYTFQKAKECLGEAISQPPRSRERRQRHGSISQGIAIGSTKLVGKIPGRSSSQVVSVTKDTLAGSQPGLQATSFNSPFEWLENHVRQGGETHDSWEEALPHLEALRFDVVVGKQSQPVVNKLMCALMHQINPARKRHVTKVAPSVAYCSELVLTAMTVLSIGRDDRLQVWESSRFPLALLNVYKKALRMSHEIGPTEAAYARLVEGCAALWNVLCLDEPKNRLAYPTEQDFWPTFIELLIAHIQHDVCSDAIKALANVVLWPEQTQTLKETINDLLPLIVPQLWSALLDDSIDEALADATIQLLMQARSVSINLQQSSLSSAQTKSLMLRLSKHSSLYLHDDVLRIAESSLISTSFDGPNDAGECIVSICNSLTLHSSDVAVQTRGLKVLLMLLPDALEYGLEPALQLRVAARAVHASKNFTYAPLWIAASRILLVMLDGDTVSRQCALSSKGVVCLLESALCLLDHDGDEYICEAVSILLTLSVDQVSLAEMKHHNVVEELVEKLCRCADNDLKHLIVRTILNLSFHFEGRQLQSSPQLQSSITCEELLNIIADPSSSEACVLEVCTLLSVVLKRMQMKSFPVEIVFGESVVLAKVDIRVAEVLFQATLKWKNHQDISEIGFTALCICLKILQSQPKNDTDSGTITKLIGSSIMFITDCLCEGGPITEDKLILLRHLVDLKTLPHTAATKAAQTMESIVTRNRENIGVLALCFDVLESTIFQTEESGVALSDEFLFIVIESLSREHMTTPRSIIPQLLAKLVKQDFRVIRRLVILPQFHPTIIDCLCRHSENLSIQRDLCYIVETLVVVASDVQLTNIANNGGMNAIVAALGKHGEDPELIISSCRALVGFLTVIDADYLWKQKEQVTSSLNHALRCSVGNLTVSLAILDAWHHLCALKDYFKQHFTNYIPLLILSMELALTNLDFQKTACSVLRMLASFGEARKIATHKKALTVLLDSLLVHCDSACFLTDALALLTLLAGEKTARSKLKESLEVLICLGRIHVHNASILSEIIAASNNVAVDFLNRKVAIPLSSDLLEMVCFAMSEYPNHAGIQRNATQLLHSHSFCPESIQVMRKQNGLVRLLVTARSNFWNECANRAGHVIQRLS